MELIQLKAVRERLPASQVGKYDAGNITLLFDMEGNLKATIPATARQPRKGSKTIVLNCFTYSLVWG